MDTTYGREQNSLRDAITLTAIFMGMFAATIFLFGDNYLLFHTFIELFSAAVGLMLFSIAWHTRKITTSDYVTFVGMATFPIAMITILHTLAYKGMPVFPGHDTNLPTTLWIVARSIQASAFLVAPVFLVRRLRSAGAVLGIYIAIGALLVIMTFTGLLPRFYVEGTGLTPVKIGMEYAVIAATLIGAILLSVFREHVQPRVYWLLLGSMFATVFAELAFTLYTDVTGILNRLGHIAHLTAFLLIYFALVSTSLEQPLTALFLQLKKEQHALSDAYQIQHDIAETLQSAMALSPEDVLGVELCYRYLPAPGIGRIGGDFYDVFSLGGTSVGFTIGDVCGKGLGAATETVKARSSIKALAMQGSDAAEVLEAANAYLHTELDDDSFVTAVFGTIDTSSGRVSLAIAGHPDPVICGRADEQPPDGARSQPLGVLPELGVHTWDFVLVPGESLLLVTDGIIEAPGKADRFGEERLREVVGAIACGSNAEELISTVLEELESHSGVGLNDDIAIVAVHFPARPCDSDYGT